MVGLGDIANGGFESVAYGVSDDGSVVVGQGQSSTGPKAFRWTSAGMVQLSEFSGDSNSVAYDVSGDGSVIVGKSRADDFEYQAFRWEGAMGVGVMSGLPGSSAYSISEATDVSDDGSVVVGTLNGGSNGAFRWTAAGGVVELGGLPGGAYLRSFATGVSGDGSIVFGESNSSDGFQAFVWNQDDGMQSLREVMLAQGIDLAARGWSGLNPQAANSDGSVLIGYGTHNGQTEAFHLRMSLIWDGSNSSHWNDPANWSFNRAPLQTFDDAVIDGGKAADATVILSDGHTIRSLLVDEGDRLVMSNFASLTLSNSNGPEVINNGTISAGGIHQIDIDLQSGEMYNNNLIRAEGSGGLQLRNGDVNNTSATLEAADGSNVDFLNAHVFGGTLKSTGTGAIYANAGSKFQSVEIAPGSVVKQENDDDVILINGMTNNGAWYMDFAGTGQTTLIFDDIQTLDGTGELVLSDSTGNVLHMASDATIWQVTNGTDHTIRGAGHLMITGGAMINNGTILAEGTNPMRIIHGDEFVNNPGGILGGTGTLEITEGTLTNDGVIAPGLSVGALRLEGNVVNTDTAELRIELDGDLAGEFDVLNVFGSFEAAGDLNVLLGFAPSPGDAFTILTNDGSDMVQGTFADGLSTTAFFNDTPYDFAIDYAAGDGNDITLAAASLPGDYNGNGMVDAADYTVWRDTLVGTTSYEVWRENFGRTAVNGSAIGSTLDSAVPEPAAWSMALLAAFLVGISRVIAARNRQFTEGWTESF